jgi:hypothetical protein
MTGLLLAERWEQLTTKTLTRLGTPGNPLKI